MEIHQMKKLFTLLLIALFTYSAQARHHAWHHQDWLGLTISAAIVTAIAATPPEPIVQETVIVTQPAPVIVQQPVVTTTPVVTTPIVVKQPVVVQQPAPVIVTAPVIPLPLPSRLFFRPLPPPPPPRRAPPPPRRPGRPHRR